MTAALKHFRDEGMPEDFWVRLMRERNERKARIALGDDGYEAAVRAGEALSRDDAIELALTPVSRPTADEQAPSRLTAIGGRRVVTSYFLSRGSACDLA